MYLNNQGPVLHLQARERLSHKMKTNQNFHTAMNHIFSFLRVSILGMALLAFSPIFLFAQNDTTASADASDAAPTEAGGGDDAAIQLGETVFTANCARCHAFNKVVVGPALKGSLERWPSREVLHTFIKYPQKVIDAGEVAHAVELYEKYKQYMPNHDHLSDEEIDAVISYIETGGPPPEETAAVSDGAAVAGDGAASTGIDNTTITIIFGALGVILLLVLVILLLVIFALTSYLKRNEEQLDETEREIISQRFDLGAVLRSPAFIGIVTFVVVVLSVKEGFDFVYGVGIQQGYAPTQPIPFSHKLHAGNYEIDCQYCHTGVRLGKSAHIPSVNICMNCHNAVKTLSPNIQKLYAAVENQKPVEWVRVHNLPDLAYFNHSQHVVVGQLECQTCHGPVEEMEVIEQFSSLTMGWCINCHRETVVKAEGNPYYERLVEFHDNVEASTSLHVEDIGGLECGRCHY